MKYILTTLALLGAATHAVAEPAGLRHVTLEMPHHGSKAAVSIWYPTDDGDAPTIFAENPVFEGVQAYIDAKVQYGRHPVVMFSHGMGGTDRAQAWLTAGLAERGAIVVAVNHPHSTWGDFDMSQGVKHWTRVADLSVALDNLQSDPAFRDHIDPARIMASGFSYGGWTALSMGGLMGNHQGLVDTCTAQIGTMEACDMLLSDDVRMQDIDPGVWNASYADPRITHVAAIDPGFVWGLTAEDAADLVPNVLMIGFGGADDRMSATNFDDSGLVDLLANPEVIRLDPAFHFTAMPLCKPAGEDILKEEGDDAVCNDPVGTDRAEVHQRIIGAIAAALEI
ncbi:MAG: putative dienelactone hydrolase [Loktanella salsilacus]|jgi:predicted dienelactone hydrolase|uniref:alpha/beta hydrolase family protein n=1 Tax=Loktanella salsilacus TaxID=195913 RepID=UPI0039899608